MTDDFTDVIVHATKTYGAVADALQAYIEQPYGPKVDTRTVSVAGEACIQLCEGDQDKARALWRQICADLGYMPQSAAVALIRASRGPQMVPDVTAPEL